MSPAPDPAPPIDVLERMAQRRTLQYRLDAAVMTLPDAEIERVIAYALTLTDAPW